MAADLLATAATAGFLLRQAATAAVYTRVQLGYTDRSRLFASLRPGHRLLEIGPGEGACHRHFPPGLHYTVIDPSPGVASKPPSRRDAPPELQPPLPVQQSCSSFAARNGFWQLELPRLAAESKRFDAVLVTLPSTIYFGPEDGLAANDAHGEPASLKAAALLRGAFRVPRPRAEWQRFASDARELLAPGGALLVADVSATHSWAARLALPLAQWEPPLLSASLLAAAGFSQVEVVSGPKHWWHDAEVCLIARH